MQNRGDVSAFEPAPSENDSSVVRSESGEEIYTVNLEGQSYTVTVSDGGDISGIVPVQTSATEGQSSSAPVSGGEPVNAPLAGNIFRVMVSSGQQVNEGDTLLVLEAMKMETEVSANKSGIIGSVNVKEGDVVAVGDTLLTIA